MPPIAPLERPEPPLFWAVDVGEEGEEAVAAADTGGATEEEGGFPEGLGVAEEGVAVVEDNACRSDKLMGYLAADGRADMSDCAVSFTTVALRRATGSLRVLQQILTWFALSVQISLVEVSRIHNNVNSTWT
ncbi:Amelogenin domain containing protein [Pyrenophora tritici-repentis]|uniref:Amelogenin domain containing protein n=1 Tax=Pyrenophora tritici-repentis TaxID=45151 RepID=A0A317AM80_9PLEO|nr:hypothetical protein A1F99_086300 [Pyrenophora tritici-repentis]KAF7569529.1 Amelogenin domain containing protein [Pyrenophora tritici-repentis]KAI1510357.1 hypothetical protein Ptr86124_010803 [Pyrenophora tritici-repentis]KAI1680703.1 hypothetical protein KJE20_09554 [Pyrenophora tritici-repentis]